MTLLFMLWLGTLAFANLMRGTRPEFSALALALVLFSFVGNTAGSFLLNHNSIFWLLLVVAFAKFRDSPDAEFNTRNIPRYTGLADMTRMRMT
jgi:hypothetical protein